jgi:adenine phosphoribosyltransferase
MELLAKRLIRDVRDFPKAGILFKDVTPVLQDPVAFQEVIDRMLAFARPREVDVVAGIEPRGFVFGAPLAIALGAGFAPVRKLGKLPGETLRVEYALEYGTNAVEMQKDAVEPGQRVLIVDDILVSGGTSAAVIELVESLGGEVAGLVFLAEMGFRDGRAALDGYEVCTLIEL